MFCLKYPWSQKNKQNMIMTTYKELLETCIKSKKVEYIYIYIYIHINIQYVPNQINASKNCFTTFGSSACQSLS